MMIVVIGFHVMLVVSIVLLILALRERKAKKLLESASLNDLKTNEGSRTELVASESNALDEKKQAVRLIHNALENVINSFDQAVADHASLNDLSSKKNSTAATVDDTENTSESEIN